MFTQGFTTGSDTGGYRLQGIGVNVDGSGLPDDGTSVTVSLYTADANGKPDAKQFDLVSPDEFAAGHNFFEAPAGTTLAASTAYVVVWRHNGGTGHRLRFTKSNGEDSGAFGGATVADAVHFGAGPSNVAVDAAGHSMEIAVYTDTVPGTVVYTDISPGNATGLPVVLASAEGGGAILAADTSRIADENGLPYTGSPDSFVDYVFSYQWIQVDGEAEIEVGTDSQRYQPVSADIGKLIRVRVSFTDQGGAPEVLTSVPFGPIPGRLLSGAPKTLVGNTEQSPSTTANISGDYAMRFKWGNHGQGYEISSVSIDLAAVPSSLNVALWTGGSPGSSDAGTRTAKLFEFENPSSFQVGLNEFTAPAGAFAYQHATYFIVLSGFGASLSINETTSDDEDEGGETGATLFNDAGGDSSVLRLAIKGSRRTSGILASNFAQPTEGDQEVISIGDKIGYGITVAAADRYLLRGVTFSMDGAGSASEPGSDGPFTNPFYLRSGSLTGDRLFDLVNTFDLGGLPVWTAPQGATVAGGCTTDPMTMEVTCNEYVFHWNDFNVKKGADNVERTGAVLARSFLTRSTGEDQPTAPGVTLTRVPGVGQCRSHGWRRGVDGRARRGAGRDGAEPGPDRRPLPDRRLRKLHGGVAGLHHRFRPLRVPAAGHRRQHRGL